MTNLPLLKKLSPRPIDANSLMDKIRLVYWSDEEGKPHKAAYMIPANEVMTAPKLDVRSNSHAHWIHDEASDTWSCSYCHATLERYDWDHRNYYYCYNCGCQMDEKTENITRTKQCLCPLPK